MQFFCRTSVPSLRMAQEVFISHFFLSKGTTSGAAEIPYQSIVQGNTVSNRTAGYQGMQKAYQPTCSLQSSNQKMQVVGTVAHCFQKVCAVLFTYDRYTSSCICLAIPRLPRQSREVVILCSSMSSDKGESSHSLQAHFFLFTKSFPSVVGWI